MQNTTPYLLDQDLPVQAGHSRCITLTPDQASLLANLVDADGTSHTRLVLSITPEGNFAVRRGQSW